MTITRATLKNMTPWYFYRPNTPLSCVVSRVYSKRNFTSSVEMSLIKPISYEDNTSSLSTKTQKTDPSQIKKEHMDYADDTSFHETTKIIMELAIDSLPESCIQ